MMSDATKVDISTAEKKKQGGCTTRGCGFTVAIVGILFAIMPGCTAEVDPPTRDYRGLGVYAYRTCLQALSDIAYDDEAAAVVGFQLYGRGLAEDSTGIRQDTMFAHPVYPGEGIFVFSGSDYTAKTTDGGWGYLQYRCTWDSHRHTLPRSAEVEFGEFRPFR